MAQMVAATQNKNTGPSRSTQIHREFRRHCDFNVTMPYPRDGAVAKKAGLYTRGREQRESSSQDNYCLSK